MHTDTPLFEEKLLRLPQVLERFPVGKTTWWCGVRDGKFPRPVRLGPRSVAWRASAIQALIEELSEGSGESLQP